jgi:probable HAF family extracellular repeat protein
MKTLSFRLFSILLPVAVCMTAACICPAPGQAAQPYYFVTELIADTGIVYGMNDKGEVVGAMGSGTQGQGFKFSAGVITDLSACLACGGGRVGPGCYNMAINNGGQVACTGWGKAPGIPKALLISAAGEQRELSALTGGGSSFATAINDGGEVVGFSPRSNGTLAPVSFNGSRAHDLGMPESSVWGEAYGINKSGYVYGAYRFSNDDPNRPFFFKGRFTDLGLVDGVPSAINSSGQIVGTANDASKAFIYSKGTVTELDAFLTGGGSGAYAINDHGQVVGSADTADCSHAFLYDIGTKVMTDLHPAGSSAFGCSSNAVSINNNGEVVGLALMPDGITDHAFLYRGGQMIDLNTLIDPSLGITLNSALMINNAGQIIAKSLDGFVTNTYLLTPPSLVHTISGASKTSANGPIAGVTMTLSRGASTIVISPLTSSSGTYAFDNLLNGSYTVTSSLTGYRFAPKSATVTLKGKDRTGLNFTGTPVTISGTVKPFKGKQIPADLTVAVNLADKTGNPISSTNTKISGYYEFDGVDGTYIVTPVPPQSTAHITGGANPLAFVPPSATVTVHGKSAKKLNFHYNNDGTCKNCH